VANRYDAVVIGAGPAGEVVAGALADGGMKVAVVERELVAGECSYWACIPSKTLLRPGEAVQGAKEAPGAAEAITGPIDVASALEWRDFMVSDYDDSSQVKWLEENGIDLVRGEGRIDGPGRVAVGDRVLETKHIVVATGSYPIIPPVDGLRDLEGVWTNREATGLKEVPESVAVMGAGPVGVEMAQILHRFGAKVTLIEGSGHALPREAKAAGLALEEALRDEGIDVRCGVKASSAAKSDGQFVVTLEDGAEVRTEKLVVATGRAPRVNDIGLDSVAVDWDEKTGLKVDEQLRAGDGVWAVGDVTGVALFTHVGKYQSRIAARVMLGGSARADYRAIPRVVFTDPQVAAVGSAEGKESATAHLAGVARTSTYTRNYDEKPGFLTLVSDGEKLIGAYAVGPEAGEWLGQATLAIKAEIPIDVLADTIQPFPSFSEAYLNALVKLE
jgi:pyruvate/2-oxoglutarate dehydrogenase complex dihydrolipoamide dehydrogenase (E3) component